MKKYFQYILILSSLVATTILVWYLGSHVPHGSVSSAPRSMPPLSPQWESMRDYYKFYFLPDGYPGRYEDGKVFEHPIYGAYILGDYIKQYRQSPTDELREAIVVVADAIIQRMDNFHNALVFWYPVSGMDRACKKYYSGLTQSYYMLHFYEAFQITGDPRYQDASERIFQSLMIPDEGGGVYYSWSDGVSVEEIPMQPNALVLNGWLTILMNLNRYGQLTGSAEAQKLFDESAQTLVRLLPLYDAAEYRNSRYGLTGPQQLKLEFSPSATDIVIRRLTLEVPGEGFYDVPLQENTCRWDYSVFEEGTRNSSEGISLSDKMLRMNLILSRLSFPEENVLHLSMDSPRQLEMEVSLSVGVYDPLGVYPVENEWRLVTTLSVEKGLNNFAIPLPWEMADLIAYPTYFKHIDDGYYNVYHFIHIKQLRRLYDITGYDIFLTFADQWENYVTEWPGMEIYRGVEHGRY